MIFFYFDSDFTLYGKQQHHQQQQLQQQQRPPDEDDFLTLTNEGKYTKSRKADV